MFSRRPFSCFPACRYKESIKSPIADLINTAGRPGGSIKAALFLQEVSSGAGPPRERKHNGQQKWARREVRLVILQFCYC